MDKLAFLFLTIGKHKSEESWKLFFNNIDPLLYNIYCHPKNEKLLSNSFLKSHIIPDRVNTKWGDISLVKATLCLLKYSYLDDNKNKYFILISDSCVPIIDFSTIYKKITNNNNKSIIHYKLINNREDRYNRLPLFFKNKIDYKYFYSQHQWMVLNRYHTNIFINNDFTNIFSKMHAADEHYFIIILYLKGEFKNITNHKITYCDWSDKSSSHPKEFNIINNNLLGKLYSENLFFIRKISKQYKINLFLKYIYTHK